MAVALFRRRSGPAAPVPEAAPVGPEEARRAVAQRILAAAPTCGAELVAGLRPAVRFATRRQPDAAADVGRTKLGGAPDLPPGTRWPSCDGPDGERHPLQFFAQIDLAAVGAAAPGALDLPAGGQLSFFADFGGEAPGDAWVDRAAVLWSPPDAQLMRCSPRLRPVPPAGLMPLPTWTWPEPGAAPPGEVAALGELRRALDAEAGAGLPEPWFLRAGHQVGGHLACGGMVGDTGDFRPVLLLDSDPTLELTWGAGPGGALVWAVAAGGGWEPARFALRTRREPALGGPVIPA